jgi:hypothetical protein
MKVESAVQKLLPTLRDPTKASKFLDLIAKCPMASEWIDDMAEEIADSFDDDIDEIEGRVRAAIVLGMLIGEEAANVSVD